uniref:Uncharacterized protein n=1 Tax=Meloidogyne floridensis TaxID=298350 RepID=A0A915NXD4_9BILA
MRPTQILILDEEEETQNNGSNESIPNSYLRSQSPGMLGTPTSGLVSGREHHVMHIQSGHSPRQNAFNFGSTKCIAQSPSNNTASPLRRRQPPPPLHLCNSGENNKGFYIL